MKYDPSPEFVDLMAALLDDEITPADNRRLVEIISSDAEARDFYREMVKAHALMVWQLRPVAAPMEELPEIGPLIDDVPIRQPSYGLFRGVSHGVMGFFSHELAVSMLVAAVFMSMALLFAWIYKISPYRQIGAIPPAQNNIERETEMVFVGRITGAKNCTWAKSDNATCIGSSVSLDREYALSSGLLEITYKSGARVILEGPCTYKVDSDAGGYLARGKLTARVETKGSGVRGQESEHSPLSSLPSPLFAVRTPTALITDLGTEFGVEVSENGDTVSYVFQGSISVQGLAASVASGATEKVLYENESIRVSRVRETHQESNANEQVRFTHPTTQPKFVRQLREPLKYIDLLDIVAGGNGRGNRCERGIDPATGREAPVYLVERYYVDNQYKPVAWSKFIDGVFIVDGRTGTVQIDSLGGGFDGFPDTDGRTCGPMWVRGPKLSEMKLRWGQASKGMFVYSMGNAEHLMPQGRGALCSVSNMGITFNLNAVRKSHNIDKPIRFQATIGMVDAHYRLDNPTSMADVWVLVDGKVKFKRMKVLPGEELIDIDVELKPTDRFLTYVTTDGGNSPAHDWMILGDPVLRLTPDGPE